MSNAAGNLALVKQLVDHEAFHINNPNNCYSLFLGFARSPVNFHAADGSGAPALLLLPPAAAAAAHIFTLPEFLAATLQVAWAP